MTGANTRKAETPHSFKSAGFRAKPVKIEFRKSRYGGRKQDDERAVVSRKIGTGVVA